MKKTLLTLAFTLVCMTASAKKEQPICMEGNSVGNIPYCELGCVYKSEADKLPLNTNEQDAIMAIVMPPSQCKKAIRLPDAEAQCDSDADCCAKFPAFCEAHNYDAYVPEGSENCTSEESCQKRLKKMNQQIQLVN